MAEAAPANDANGAPPRKGGKKKLLFILAPLLALGAGAGAAFFFVPSVHDMIAGGGGEKGEKHEAAEAEKPSYVEIPEMTVTMPNGGRPRQLRIKLALELAKHKPEGGGEHSAASEMLTPRIYDALVLYLRTLRDSDVEGALAVDRVRGDLLRRLDLLLGDGALRDVLITSMVIG